MSTNCVWRTLCARLAGSLLMLLCFDVLPAAADGGPRAAPAARPTAPPRPRLSLTPEVLTLARQLGTLTAVDDRADTTPTPSPGDPGLPSIGLRLLIGDLDGLLLRADPDAAPALQDARNAAGEAWRLYAAGSPDLGHLGRTTDQLLRAQRALRRAVHLGGPDTGPAAAALQEHIAALSRRMASDVMGVARRAVSPGRLRAVERLFELGDLAAARGDTVNAVVHFGGALGLAANTITFDIALFEENIKNALAGQTVGHAFSIAYLGQLYQDGESAGLARTAANAPQTAQSPAKEMHVASVSKTLTTIVTLRLLEDSGLTPDEPIAPYLPGDWVFDPAIAEPGPNQLTFRHFFTHTSGFGQVNAGSDYAALETAIGLVTGPQPFNYQNANFALMRVLVAGLLGIDPVDFEDFDPGALTAAIFILTAQQLYTSIGVQVDCQPNDATATVQYNLPDGGLAGYVEPNRQLTCGGYGGFISSNELASVLTNLRHTENLLTAEGRALMQEGFLGFMDPANYGFIGGTFGVYSMHGGDWFHSPGELHSCVVAFPIQVEVGLVINSERGAMPYQCSLLQSAFDDAWVQK